MSDIDIKSYEHRLKYVLNLLLQDNFKTSDDVYLEMIISHASGKYNAELGDQLLQLPICMEWVEATVKQWEITNSLAHPSVTTFFIRFLSLLTENELRFTLFTCKKTINRIIILLKQSEQFQKPSVKLAYVQLLVSFSKHRTGLNYIKANLLWRDVVINCHENHTIYVVRESSKFIYDIICKFSQKGMDYDNNVVQEILKMALEPLTQKLWQDQNNLMNIEDTYLTNTLTPTLNLLIYLMEEFLKTNSNKEVAKLLLTDFKIEWHAWNLLSVTHCHLFLSTVMKLMALVMFTKIENGEQEAEQNLKEFGLWFVNVVNIIICKQSSLNVLKLCDFCHLYWNHILSRIPKKLLEQVHGNPVQFENQLIILQIMPILVAIRSPAPKGHEFLDLYAIKLFKISCEHTVRLAYAFRDVLRTAPNLDDIANRAILSLLSMKTLLSRDRAVIVFQALIYILRDFAPEGSYYPPPENHCAAEIIHRAPHLLGSVLHALHTLLQNFKITWTESIESTSLLNFCLALLDNSNLPARLTVQALQLTQLGIEKFMAPALALLMDQVEGSGMETLGPLIKKRLHDPHWEVRDSALELLQSISNISELKFPAFQNHILMHDLPALVVTIALGDSESYVRASCWKCILAMVRVDSLWEQSLRTQNLQNKLTNVVFEDAEAIVRQEAVATLSEISKNREILRVCLCKTMKHAAINDLHWEVQVNALKFWKEDILRHCQNQGMIDGTFPQVTFSREKRKIVTLTSTEIVSRLLKVLQELANNGCLEVLVSCLQDHTDLEVMKLGCEIVRNFVTLLTKYNVTLTTLPKHLQTVSTPMNVEPENLSLPKKNKDSGLNHEESIFKEDIINGIVDSDDMNLLTKVYENQMNLNSEIHKKKAVLNDNIINDNKVTVAEFMLFIEDLNLEKLINDKSNWISGLSDDFGSLLDDIIGCHGGKYDGSSNSMDCY